MSLPEPSEFAGMQPGSDHYNWEAAEAEIARLRAAIEEYRLWEPGRAGHAAAHRKLMEALR